MDSIGMANIRMTKHIVKAMVQFFVITLEGKTEALFIRDWANPSNPEYEDFITRASLNGAIKETIGETVKLLEDSLK